MALQDAFGIGDDQNVDPQSVVDSLLAQRGMGLPEGQTVDPQSILNRLIRRGIGPHQLPREEQAPAQGGPEDDPARYGKPVGEQENAPDDPAKYGRPVEGQQTASGEQRVAPTSAESGALGGPIAGAEALVSTPITMAGQALKSLSRVPVGVNPETGEGLQNAENLPTHPEQMPNYRLGEAITGAGEAIAPSPQQQAEHPIWTGVGAGIGGMIPGLALSAIPGIGPAAAVAGTAALFGASSAEDTFEAAKQPREGLPHGVDDQTALAAAQLSGAANAVLGTIPIGSVLNPVAKFLGPAATSVGVQILANAAKEGVVFTTVGEAQDYIGQKIAAAYDPKAGYNPTLARLAAEFTTGAILGAFHGPAAARQARQQGVFDFLNSQYEGYQQATAQPGLTYRPGEAGTETGAETGPGPGPQPRPGQGGGGSPRYDARQTGQGWRVYDNFMGDWAEQSGMQFNEAGARAFAEQMNRQGAQQAGPEGQQPGAEAQQPQEPEQQADRNQQWRTEWEKTPGPDATELRKRAQTKEQIPGRRGQQASGSNTGSAFYNRMIEQFGFEPDDLKNASRNDLRVFAQAAEVLQAHGHTTADIAKMGPKEMQAAIDGIGDRAKGEDIGAMDAAQRAQEAQERARGVVINTEADLRRAERGATEDNPRSAFWNGLRVSIEVPKGGTRGGVTQKAYGETPAGTRWESTHPHAYGEIVDAPNAADGMKPDIILGDHPSAPQVFLIDESDRYTGKYKQTKAFAGFQTPADAYKSYVGISTKDPAQVMGMRAIPRNEFNEFVAKGGMAEPASEAAHDTIYNVAKGMEPGVNAPGEEPKAAEGVMAPGPEPTAAHRQAIVDALQKVGANPRSVRPVIIQRAAEIHEHEGYSPEEAYQLAVIRQNLDEGRVTPEQVNEVYGEKIASAALLQPGQPRTAGGVRTEARGGATGGETAAPTGERVPSGAENVPEGAEAPEPVSEAGGVRRGAAAAGHPAAGAAEPEPAAGRRQPAEANAGRAGGAAARPPEHEPAVDAATAPLIGEPVNAIAPHSVTAADGTKVQVKPVVVEARDLTTSSDEGYDKRLQPRQRERAAAQAQIKDIATRLDPERLGYSAEADRGAPIVGPDGMVESGNGRVQALRLAYQQLAKKHFPEMASAQRYQDWLEKQGVDLDRYEAPILVRQRVSNLTQPEREQFTVAANQAATLAMSAPERALADAKHVTPDMLDLLKDSDLSNLENRGFMRAFAGALPASERGSLSTRGGDLSAEGLSRARNAILAKAYGDADIIARVTEATDDDVKSLSNGLVQAAPAWAKLRAAIEAGSVPEGMDLTPELMEAVKRTADLRTKGMKLEEYLAQQDAFDQISDDTNVVIRNFYDPNTKRAKSSARIGDFLRFYANEAAKVSAEAGLGLEMPEVGRHEVLRTAEESQLRQAPAEAAAKTRAGAGNKAQRNAQRRPGAGATGGKPHAGGPERYGRKLGELEQPFAAEPGAEGKPQLVIPGAEQRSSAELARRRAAEPLRPRVAQKAPTEGLFAEPAKQTEMFAAKPAEFRGPLHREVHPGPEAQAAYQQGVQDYGKGIYNRAFPHDDLAAAYDRGLQDAKNAGKPEPAPAAPLGVPPVKGWLDHLIEKEETPYERALATEKAWQAELQKQFGKEAGDIRYTPRAKGEPGSALREAHDAYVKARNEWQASKATKPEGAPHGTEGQTTTKETPTVQPAVVRGAAPAVPRRGVAAGVGAKKAGRNAPQPSLFDWSGSERPLPLDARKNAEPPEGPEPPVPSEGNGVTKPPSSRARTGNAPNRKPAVRRGLSEAQEKIAERSRLNYRITDDDYLGEGGPKTKVRGNIDAIRIIRDLEQDHRFPTPEEKAKLVKYVGWGQFAQDMFKEKKPEWAAERDALKSLLTPEEYEAARASTLNAHFTSPDVIRGIYTALDHLGFDGGLALEPSAGIGHFIGLVPDKFAPKTAWTAAELDPTSGKIAQALYGGAEVNIGPFEDLDRPSNYYDLAVSNVPFGDYPITRKPYGSHSIHDFFFVKSLDKVRPGGVVAFITSRYTMDKQDPAIRKLLAEKADLIGAIRLPGGKEGAFAKNAGTQVTTDIVFLRKKIPGEAPFAERSGKVPEWMNLKEIETPEGPVKINEYFADRREKMLGDMRLIGTQYGKNEPVLIGEPQDLARRIEVEASNSFGRGAFAKRGTGPPPEEIPAYETKGAYKDGAYFVRDGKVYRQMAGRGVEQTFSSTDADRVTRLATMRDHVNDLLAAQLANQRSETPALRNKLSNAYKAFVKKYGPINHLETTVTSRLTRAGEPVVIERMPNFDKFRDDPDSFKVAALEEYDRQTDKATPAAIMERDVIAPPDRPDIRSPADALAASLDATGNVDLDHIANSLGLPSHDDVAQALGDLVYLDPDGQQWRTADDYLSGEVVRKLENARAIAKTDPTFQRNVEALEKAQPKPLTRMDITAQLGAPWIPEDVYEQFAKEELGAYDAKVRLVPVTGAWRVTANGVSRDASSKYATKDFRPEQILRAAINNKQLTAYDRDSDGKSTVNAERTEEARIKTRVMREAFAGDIEKGLTGWVFGDNDRAERLEEIYNRTNNDLVGRKFDGSHLSLPGLNPMFAGWQHRKDAVWRMIQRGNTLLAHEVGLGKTVTMVTAGMEMKRLGLIRKPTYVVPNHMLEQFSREFLQAYPNAKVLVASKQETTRDNRRAFVAKVAANDWDGVVMTHDAFGRMNMGIKWRKDFVKQQIDEVDRFVAAEQQGSDRDTVKQLEKAKKKLQDRLLKLMNLERKDEGVNFEESGIDHLFVDEAHKFKNLQFITRMQNVKGLSNSASQRAEDLYLKIRYLEQKRPGRSAVFATGTPVSNTMAELWTTQRYLQLDKLRQRGLDTFDGWAGTYGDTVTRPELSADGRSLKDVTSFARFVNIPELMHLYSDVADYKTAEMVGAVERPQIVKPDGTPGITVVEAELSPQEDAYVQSLVKRAEEGFGRPKKGEPNFLSAVLTPGRKVALDGRLISNAFEFNPRGKIGKLIDNVHREWREGTPPGMAQMIFLDMGTPHAEARAPTPEEIEEGADIADRDPAEAEKPRVDLYADIKRRLVDRGIPAKQIAFIHDANTDIKKGRLFEKVRSGEVRVILGSSEKMGVGTNVQKQLVAGHQVDPPYKPAEVNQRAGRWNRQGNLNKKIREYHYVTPRSFDGFMWQTLERKAKFLTQIMSGAAGKRVAEDVDSPLPSAAELKAAASGDPRIFQFAELQRDVNQLVAQKRFFEESRLDSNRQAKSAQSNVQMWAKDLPKAEADAAKVPDIRADKFKMKVGDQEFTERTKAGEEIIKRIGKMDPADFRVPKVVRVGSIGPFDANVRVGAQTERYVDRNNEWQTRVSLNATPILSAGSSDFGVPRTYAAMSFVPISGEYADPFGLIRRFENSLGQIADEPRRLAYHIDEEKKNIERLKSVQASVWPKEAELAEKARQLKALETELKAPKAKPTLDIKPGLVAHGEQEAGAVKAQWRAETPIESVDRMTEAAPANQKALGDVLRQVGAEQGLTVIDPGVKTRSPAEIAKITDPKEREKQEGKLKRFKRKIVDEQGNIIKKPGTVTDLVRASVVVPQAEQADDVVLALAKHFQTIDEGWVKTYVDYFDRKLYVRFPDGMIGEVQIHHPMMVHAKEKTKLHALYAAGAALPPNHPLKPELDRAQQEIYSSVYNGLSERWLNAVAGNGGKSPNLLLKLSGESSLPASPTSVESTRFQAPSSNAQASPGPQYTGSPFSIQTPGFGEEVTPTSYENIGIPGSRDNGLHEGPGVFTRAALTTPQPGVFLHPPFQPQPGVPLGRQAQDYVVSRGRATGVEHMVAYHEDGSLAEHAVGTDQDVTFTPEFNEAIYDPNNRIVVHHNHPSNSTLSDQDIAMLAAPGIHSLWAHGHEGKVSRAGLTDYWRDKTRGIEPARNIDALGRLRRGVTDTYFMPVLGKLVEARKISPERANDLVGYLSNETLRQLGIIDYQTNDHFEHEIEQFGLQPYLDNAIYRVKGTQPNVYTGPRKPPAAGDDRLTRTFRHQGDVGAVFDKAKVAPDQYPQSPALDRARREDARAAEFARQLLLALGGPNEPKLGLEESKGPFGNWKPPGAGPSAKATGPKAAAGAGGAGKPPPPPRPPRAAAAPGQPNRGAIINAISGNKLSKTLKNFWTSTFQPELVSSRAFAADPLFAKYKAATQQDKVSIIKRDDDDWHYWNKQPASAHIRFLDDVETAGFGNVPPNPREAAMAKRYKAMLDENYQEEKQFGSKAGYREDYFPHVWEKPDDYQAYAQARTAQLGPTWFQKERVYDYITDGLMHGHKLRFTNPVDLMNHRLLSGADMKHRMELLQDLKEMQLAYPYAQGGEQLSKRGWQIINAPNREQWVIAPDVQQLWKNAVEARSLWDKASPGGGAFRAWMAFKAVWVPIKIGLSMFHPVHIDGINWAQSMALATDLAIKNRDLGAAFKEAASGFANAATGGFAGHYQAGRKAVLGWEKPLKDQTPQERRNTMIMAAAGYSPQPSEEMQIRAKRQLSEAFAKIERGEAGAGDWWKFASALVRRPSEIMQHPFFGVWIPALKTSALLRQAEAWTARHPNFSDEEFGIAMRAIGKGIDDRYGEMNYGTLFWNRAVQDGLKAAMLSLGWNTGLVRQFGGAAMQVVTRPAGRIVPPWFKATPERAIAREASNHIAFVVAYATFAGALINGILTALFTHEMPTGEDFIFPRDGSLNPDGTPHRMSTPTQLREIPMWLKHVQERGGGVAGVIGGTAAMAWNKMVLEPMVELWNNRNYFGYNIWDKNAPIYKQIWQAFKEEMLSQLSPMSITGARQAAQIHGKEWPSLEGATDIGAIMSFLGYGPAPAYVSKDALQNRISYLYEHDVAPSERSETEGENFAEKMSVRQAIMIARRDHDSNGLTKAYERGKAIGLTQAYMNKVGRTPTDVYLFSKLPPEDQVAIMHDADADQKAKYGPKLKQQARQQLLRESKPPPQQQQAQ